MGAGFDTGTKGAILSVGNDKPVDVGGKDVSAKGASSHSRPTTLVQANLVTISRPEQRNKSCGLRHIIMKGSASAVLRDLTADGARHAECVECVGEILLAQSLAGPDMADLVCAFSVQRGGSRRETPSELREASSSTATTPCVARAFFSSSCDLPSCLNRD